MKIEKLFNRNFFVSMFGSFLLWIWLDLDASKINCWHIGILLISFFLINRIEIWSDSLK